MFEAWWALVLLLEPVWQSGLPSTRHRQDTYRTPSVKSWARSWTSSPHSLKLTFTQFLKVLAWICIHSSSLPRICMDLAAWPSGDLAASPARSASDILRLSAVIVIRFVHFGCHCCWFWSMSLLNSHKTVAGLGTHVCSTPGVPWCRCAGRLAQQPGTLRAARPAAQTGCQQIGREHRRIGHLQGNTNICQHGDKLNTAHTFCWRQERQPLLGFDARYQLNGGWDRVKISQSQE